MKYLKDKFKMYGVKKFFIYFFYEVKNKIFMQIIRNSYSQKGEDLAIDRLLGSKRNGFYVDIGANDPNRFSNTKRFYKKGWHGINIEPDFNNYSKFTRERARDINLNIGIGAENHKTTFYKFMPDTLSTFSMKEADRYITQGYKLVDKMEIETVKLRDILSKYCNNQDIDFFSVDTEGFDMQVLRSNDWLKFKPKVICIESVSHNINNADNKKEDNHERFLIELGYKKIYDNKLNSLFVLNKFKYDNFSIFQSKEFDKFSDLRKNVVAKKNKSSEFEYAKILGKMGDKLDEKSVLDLGCGNGRYSMELAKKAKEVVGYDISEKSIETANLISKREGINNFVGIVGDFTNFSYSNYFDYVLVVNMLHHTKDKKLILQNIRKALKYDGKLIIFEFNPLNLMFIPFLIRLGQTRSHLNFEYWRSNIFNLNKIILNNGFKIDAVEKYAFLPTSLYNYSMFFEKLNRLLNQIPLLNIFNAFNIIICTKNEK